MSFTGSRAGLHPVATSNRKKKIEIFTQNKVMPTHNKVVSLKRQTYQETDPYALSRNPSAPFINSPQHYQHFNRDRETLTETSSQKSSTGRVAVRANGLRKAEKPRLSGSKASHDSQNSLSHHSNSHLPRPKLSLANQPHKNGNKFIQVTHNGSSNEPIYMDPQSNGYSSNHKLSDYQQQQHNNFKIFKNQNSKSHYKSNFPHQEMVSYEQHHKLEEAYRLLAEKNHQLQKDKQQIEDQNKELRETILHQQNQHKEEMQAASTRMEKLYSIVADLEERIRIADREWSQYISKNK